MENGPKQMMVQKAVTAQENKEHTSQQQHCFRGNSGTPKTVAEPARPRAGRPTPLALFLIPNE